MDNDSMLAAHHLYCHGDPMTGRCILCEFELKPWASYTQLYNNQIDCKYVKLQAVNCDPCYVCTYCSTGHRSVTTMRQHLINLHSVKLFECKWCGYECDWFSAMKSHVDRHKGSAMTLRCTDCEFSCHTIEAYENHKTEAHDLIPPYNCNRCTFTSMRKDGLAAHKENHLSKGMECRECKLTFLAADLLQNHKNIFHNHSPKCTMCEFRCESLTRLITHKRSHRQMARPQNNTARVYSCTSCSFKTKWKRTIVHHVRKAQRQKVYRCHLCSYSIAKNSYKMQSHLKMHADGKNKILECLSCSYKDVDIDSLLRHSSSHEMEVDAPPKPISKLPSGNEWCYMTSQNRHFAYHSKRPTGYTVKKVKIKCAKKPRQSSPELSAPKLNATMNGDESSTFTPKSGLLLPTSISSSLNTTNQTTFPDAARVQPYSTTIKLYNCNICSFTCRKKCQLRMHMKRHTSSAPYACHRCNFFCTRRDQMARHKKTHSGLNRRNMISNSLMRCITKHHIGYSKYRKLICRLCNLSHSGQSAFLRHLCAAHGWQDICKRLSNQRSSSDSQPIRLSNQSSSSDSQPIRVRVDNPTAVSLTNQNNAESEDSHGTASRQAAEVQSAPNHIKVSQIPGSQPKPGLCDSITSSKSADFICDRCGISFKSQNHLLTHKNVCQFMYLQRCNQCEFSCRLPEQMKWHKKEAHAPKRRFNCDLCIFSTDSIGGFTRHCEARSHRHLAAEAQRIGRQPTKPNSVSCERELYAQVPEQLKSHKQQSHPLERSYNCDLCIYSTDSIIAYTSHCQSPSHRSMVAESQQTGPQPMKHDSVNGQPVKCHKPDSQCLPVALRPIMGKLEKRRVKSMIASGQPELQNHVPTTVNDVNLPFSPNPDTLTSQVVQHIDALNTQSLSQTGVTEPKPNQPQSNRYRHGQVFECELCKYSTLNVAELREHMKAQHDRKRFQCELCYFSCDRRYDLGRHKKTHTGEKPFSCTQCDYTCAHRGQLTIHERTHTGRPFKCKLCDFSSTCASNLTRHMRGHFNDRRFKCHHCAFSTYTDRARLNVHIRTHNKKMDFQCTQCAFGAMKKQILDRHIAADHTEGGSELQYKCNKCGLYFFNAKSLDNHKAKCGSEAESRVFAQMMREHASGSSLPPTGPTPNEGSDGTAVYLGSFIDLEDNAGENLSDQVVHHVPETSVPSTIEITQNINPDSEAGETQVVVFYDPSMFDV